MTNNATIETTTPECGDEPNTASASVEIIGPDVTISKTSAVTEVMRGDLVHYTITYRNGGDAPANGVEITDILPPGTTYVSDDSNLTCVGCNAGSTGPLVWNAGTLPVNSPSYSFDLTLRVNRSTPYSTTLVNNVNIATVTPECGALLNADASEGIHVIGHIDLVVLKDDDVGPSGSTRRSMPANKRGTLSRFLQRAQGYSPMAVSQHRDFVLEGDLVTYTISIVNVGNYTATNVVLSETIPLYSQYVGIGWTHVASRTYTQTVGELPPGAGRIYYFVVRIDDPIPLAVTDLDNLVCGWSDDDDLNPDDNCNPEDTPVRHPRLAIAKTADTVLSKVGHDVTYTILVCNTGDVALNKQSVVDTRIPGVNAAFGLSLAPGVCESHDFARTIQSGDPDPLVNVATARYEVEGRPDRTLVATDNYEVNLFQPSITLAKTGDALSKVGDSVNYVITLNNTSSADTPNLACTITDTMVGLNENVTLASGASHVITTTYVVPAGAGDPLVNTAQATCSPVGFSNVYHASANHSVNLFQPSITFEKTGDALSKIGDDVNYTLRLNNTSSVDTPNLECTITDAMLGINENVTLASGASHVINAAHTVPAGSPDPLVNNAQVTCSPIGFPNVYNASDDHPVNLFQPSITFAKTGDVLSKVGDPTDYTLTLNNTSSTDTPNLACTITDAMLGINENVTLASGASHVLTATYIVPAGAPDPLVNTAQLRCSPIGFSNVYTASDDHSVNLFQPSITFDKTSADTLSKVGDDVNYTLTLNNTSSADTPNLECTITDAMVGINESVTLPSGGSHVINTTYTVPAGAADPLVNTAQVNCSPVGFPNVYNASDSHSINLFQPAIAFDKSGDAVSKIGDPVNYTLTLNNNSSADAPHLVCTVTDAMLGISAHVTLAFGTDLIINAVYTVPVGAPDPLVNTAEVSCSPIGFSNVLTASDDHSLNLFQPSITFAKTGNAASKVGDSTNYTLTLNNTSSADTPNLECTITDVMLGINENITLASGTSRVLNAAYTIPPGTPDPLVNVAQVSCSPIGFPNVYNANDSHSMNLFQPSITFAKTGDAEGKETDPVDYVLTLNNTSSADTPNLECAITDAMLGINENVTLASGASHVINTSYIVPVGAPDPLVNTAQVTCSPIGFLNVYNASDSHSVNLFYPSITFAKTGDALSKETDPVDYVLTLNNTSSADTPDLACTITDAMLGINQNVTLASGASHVINATYTVPAGTADPLVNTAQVRCSPVGFPNVLTASDDHTVNLFQPSIIFVKTGDALSKVGDPVNYTLTLNNTSSADSPNLICLITDAMLGINETVTLASGASHVINAAYTVPAGAPDPLVNTAQASCSPIGFPNVLTANDNHSVNLFQPGVQVEKTGPTSAYVDSVITYTFRIINTGSADSPDLILDSVIDVGDGWPGLGNLTNIARANGCNSLPPGSSCIFEVPYTIQLSDPNPLTNTVTVNFHPDGFTNVITHSDSHTVVTRIDVDLVVTKNDDVGPTTPTSARLTADKQAAVDRLLQTRKRASLAPAQIHREFVGPGDLITFTIAVINTGHSIARDVIVTETLPLYTTYVGYGWQQVGATRNYTMSLPNLPPQVGRVITFVVRIDDPLPTGVRSIINYVCSFSSVPDTDDTDNCRYTDAPVINLGLDKEADPTSILAGEQVTFTITLSNSSQVIGSSTEGITITDGLPDGFTWISDTAETVGLTRVLTHPVVIWHTPSFTIGEQISFTLIAQASPTIACGEWVTNVVTATVRVSDHEYSWIATAGARIQCYIDLLVTKDDNVGPITPASARTNVSLTPEKQAIVERVQREARASTPMATIQQHREFVEPGDLITYTITIANVGAYTITNAVLSETIPLYTTYVGYGWTHLGGRTYITTVGTLPPGVGHVYFIVVRVDDPLPPGIHNLINYVCGWDDEPDEYPDNNCNYEDTPVHTDGHLYVANRNSGTLDVFNTTDFGYVTTIPVDVNPWGMETFGRYLYVGDFHEQDGQARLYIIDTGTNTVLDSSAVGSPIQSAHLAHMTVLTSTDVVSLYVTSHSGPPALAAINAEPPWNILDEIALNRPDTWEFGFFGATTDTTRRCVYFTKRDFGSVGIWRLCPPGDTPEYVYPTDESANEKPFSILYNPNDDLVYVAFALLNEVWIFDPNGFQLLDRVPTEAQDPTIHTGHGGQGLVASGQYVFVSNYISESLTVITNGSVARQAEAGLAVSQAEFDHRIYLPMTLRNYSGQSEPPTPPVQPTQINTVTIRLSGQPKGMAATPHLLFVTLPHEDRVAIIDIARLIVTQEITTHGDHPHSVIMAGGN